MFEFLLKIVYNRLYIFGRGESFYEKGIECFGVGSVFFVCIFGSAACSGECSGICGRFCSRKQVALS